MAYSADARPINVPCFVEEFFFPNLQSLKKAQSKRQLLLYRVHGSKRMLYSDFAIAKKENDAYSSFSTHSLKRKPAQVN